MIFGDLLQQCASWILVFQLVLACLENDFKFMSIPQTLAQPPYFLVQIWGHMDKTLNRKIHNNS